MSIRWEFVVNHSSIRA